VIVDEVGDLVLLVGEVSEAVEVEAEGVDAGISHGVVLANGIVHLVVLERGEGLEGLVDAVGVHGEHRYEYALGRA
jgi:hypothetical protein